MYRAWLLDINVSKKDMECWFKTPDRQVIRARMAFHPTVYAVHQSHRLWEKLHTARTEYRHFAHQLQTQTTDYTCDVVNRRVRAEDPDHSPCLRIQIQNPTQFHAILKDLKSLKLLTIYNCDLPLAQMFFYETELFPMAFCEITGRWNRDRFHIRHIKLLDSTETIEYDLPPLCALWIDLDIAHTTLQTYYTDPITQIRVRVDPCSSPLILSQFFPPHMLGTDPEHSQEVLLNEGNEYETLTAFERVIRQLDPDIIFTTKGDEHLFPYLLARLTAHRLDRTFSLSRDGSPLASACFRKNGGTAFMSYGQTIHRSQSEFYLTGRLHIDSAIYGGLHFDDGNLYGIIEVGRVTYSPLQRLTRVTIGGALQSLQFYNAYRQGVLIPEEKQNAEFFRSGSNLLLSDRGGHILNPQVGMFDRVAELDFTSMYPSLMVKYNVSPETLNCPCCRENPIMVPGLPYHICKRRKGIVALALRVPLAKRMRYKQLSKDPTNPLAERYHNMESALKWILVVCFGYLGFRNARFGRIEAHQTVCAYAREFLLTAKEIVDHHGLTSIHGIVDSLYVQPPETMPTEKFHEHCRDIAQEIEQNTLIPISYSPQTEYFEFMCFLPTKQDPQIGALNRYWGFKPGGKLKVRGVELRRHDSPPFIKQFQTSILQAIAHSPHRQSFPDLYRHTLLPELNHAFEQLETGAVAFKDLVITIRLTRDPHAYKVQNYQAIAAQRLQRHGVGLGPGEKVRFVITNDQAANKEDRVAPVELFEPATMSYDVGKYKELVVRALNNILPSPLSAQTLEKLVRWKKPVNKTKKQNQMNLSFYL